MWLPISCPSSTIRLTRSGIFFRVYPDEEESGFHSARLQNIQDLRGPFRIGPVIKSKRNLVFTARALMIERREFWKAKISRIQITVGVLLNLARAVHARFIDANDFAFSHICDRFIALQCLEEPFCVSADRQTAAGG